MRIVVDMQGAQTESRFRGIGRYSLSFAKALARHRGSHEVLLALNGLLAESIDAIRSAFRGLLPPEHIRVWHAPGPVRESEAANAARRRRAEWIREAFLASLRPTIVHVTSLFEGYADDAVTSIGKFSPDLPTSVTHHDLIPLHDPERFLKPNPMLEKWYRGKLEFLKRAQLLLANSDSTARDACERLGLAESRAICVSAGCFEAFRRIPLSEPAKRALLSRFAISRPFILTSGTIEPHKNLARLFRGWALLPRGLRERYQVVLVGKTDGAQGQMLREMARHAGLRHDSLVLTGHVTDEELRDLYNLCTLTIVPSYDEGFGFPALEAMACGAAVVGANATSIPEVIERADALFDPHDEAAIAAKLRHALTDETFLASLRQHGQERAEKFSWDETARRAISAMERLVESGPRVRHFSREPDHSSLEGCIERVAVEEPAPNEEECLALAQSLSWTFPRPRAARQLLVDVSELAQRDAKTGCQRVTRAVLLELLKNPPSGYRVEPIYATVRSYGYFYARSFTTRLLRRKAREERDDPIEFALGDVFFGLDYQAQIVPAQQEFLLTLRRHGIPCRFLVHDLLPVLFPGYFPAGTERGFRDWLSAIARFDGVVCVSRSTADALRSWYRQHLPGMDARFQIDWVHNGADLENSAPTLGWPENGQEVLAHLARRPSFLMVGTIEPRKGHGQALAAFEELWAQGIDVNLAIVGTRGWNVDAVVEKVTAHPERNSRLFWLDGVSDEFLEKLYASADCLIAASEGEGFGLPLIEAARHGLPILARDIPVFREVAGRHAAYFHGLAPRDLAESVKQWLGLRAEGGHPRSDHMPWLTWKESVRMLLERVLPRDGAEKHEHGRLPRRAAEEEYGGPIDDRREEALGA